MKYPIYTIKDDKVGFQIPVFDMSDQAAIRNFGFGINNSDSVMGFAPADYSLYKIGEFDTEKGTIDPIIIPEFIVSGSSLFIEK